MTVTTTHPPTAIDRVSNPVGAENHAWSIATTSGCTVTGYLPQWAEDDPSQSGVPLERLGICLADVGHRAAFAGQCLAVAPGSGPAEEAEVFWGHIECRPYAEDPEPRVPLVNIAVIDDYWITGLGPDDLTSLAGLLRAQADRLEDDVRPRLLAARDDWASRRR